MTTSNEQESSAFFYSVPMAPAYCVRLVISEDEFDQVMEAIDYDSRFPWMGDGGKACLHTLQMDRGLMFVVALDLRGIQEEEDTPGIHCASYITHEAVHIKQKIMEHLGEPSPAKEQEAYCVQQFAFSLMEQLRLKMIEDGEDMY